MDNSIINSQFSILNYLRSAVAVTAKDVRCEIRARHSLDAVVLFAVTSTVAASFTLNAWGATSEIAAALLWLVIYFSAMSGLSRSFVREEETYTASTLKLSARANAVYLGKLGFNLATLVALEIVSVPLFVILMGCRVSNWCAFLALLMLGSLTLSAGATMAAAMVSRARTRGALFAVISFPLLIPALALAIHGTAIALAPEAGANAAVDIRLLVCYCGALIVSSLMLFRFIWED